MTSTLPREETRSDPLGYIRNRLAPFPTVILIVSVVAGVLVGAAAAKVVARSNRVYQSVGAVSFDQPYLVAKSPDAGIIDKLSKLRFTYIGAAVTSDVLVPVAQQAGVDRGEVAASTFTQAPPDSLFLVVGARNSDPQLATELASLLAKQLVKYVTVTQREYNIPLQYRVIANVPVEPSFAFQVSPTSRKELTVGVIAGVLTTLLIFGLGILVRPKTR